MANSRSEAFALHRHRQNDAWLHLRATALNLNWLLVLGLTRTQTGGRALNL